MKIERLQYELQRLLERTTFGCGNPRCKFAAPEANREESTLPCYCEKYVSSSLWELAVEVENGTTR